MRHVITHYLPPEMVVLGLIEAALLFSAIYALGPLAGQPVALPDLIQSLPPHGVAGDAAALAAVLTAAAVAMGLIIGLYRPDVCLNRTRLLGTACLAAAVAAAALLIITHNTGGGFSASQTMPAAAILAAWLGIMTLIRLAYGFAARRNPVVRRVALIGDPHQTGLIDARLRSRAGRAFDSMPLQGADVSWATLRRHEVWGVVVASDPAEAVAQALLDCKFRGMKILSAAAFHERYLGRIDLDTLTTQDLLLGRDFHTTDLGVAVKRAVDIVAGSAILLLTLPVMALTALAIKIDSPGPVFYRQIRAGLFDRPFTLFKFRSMAADAEASGDPRWAQWQDPRVTRVGRFIRDSRIDELPQLMNILRGEMSLVGPRPERPHFVAQLARAIPFYRQRGYVKPGLTGWAQVNFPYGASVEDAREKLAYDLYYVKHRSAWLDATILFSTIRVVLFREGSR